MLLELVTLGPLDRYLWENSLTVKTVDLVEATACLATALWHLVNLFLNTCIFLVKNKI